MNKFLLLAFLFVLQSASGFAALFGDSTIPTQPVVISLASPPALALTRPSLADDFERPRRDERTVGTDRFANNARIGRTVGLAGVAAIIVGAIMVIVANGYSKTASVTEPSYRRMQGVFFGGLALCGTGASLGMVGLAIYGVNRRRVARNLR